MLRHRAESRREPGVRRGPAARAAPPARNAASAAGAAAACRPRGRPRNGRAHAPARCCARAKESRRPLPSRRPSLSAAAWSRLQPRFADRLAQQQVDLADIGGDEGRGQQFFMLDALGSRQHTFELGDVAIGVIAELAVLLVLLADLVEVALVDQLAGEQPALALVI